MRRGNGEIREMGENKKNGKKMRKMEPKAKLENDGDLVALRA